MSDEGPLRCEMLEDGPSQRAHLRPKSEQRKDDSNVIFSLVGVGVGLKEENGAKIGLVRLFHYPRIQPIFTSE